MGAIDGTVVSFEWCPVALSAYIGQEIHQHKQKEKREGREERKEEEKEKDYTDDVEGVGIVHNCLKPLQEEKAYSEKVKRKGGGGGGGGGGGKKRRRKSQKLKSEIWEK